MVDWDSQYETLTQVGRDEVKARMKELESELARAEQTSALREEVFCLFPCYRVFFYSGPPPKSYKYKKVNLG